MRLFPILVRVGFCEMDWMCSCDSTIIQPINVQVVYIGLTCSCSLMRVIPIFTTLDISLWLNVCMYLETVRSRIDRKKYLMWKFPARKMMPFDSDTLFLIYGWDIFLPYINYYSVIWLFDILVPMMCGISLKAESKVKQFGKMGRTGR